MISYPGRWEKPWLFWQAWWRESRCTSPRLPVWPRWCWSSTPATWPGPAQSGYLSALPEQTINRAPLIITPSLACAILKSVRFSASFNPSILIHGSTETTTYCNFNLKINLKKKVLPSVSIHDYVQLLCLEWRSILCCGEKLFYDGFQSEGKWNMDQSGFKSNIISVNSVKNEHSSIWNTHAWAHLLIKKKKKRNLWHSQDLYPVGYE